jgi:DNA-binding protein HU-beta
MNKSELVKYVSDKTKVTENDLSIIFDVFLKGIKNALERSERVTITNFGTFFLQDRLARTALNPKNQEKINVPAKTVIKFKSSKKLFDMINRK